MYVQRPIVQAGAEMVTLPGIYVPSIVRPSGGVCLSKPPGTAGCRRNVSLITAFRYGAS